MRNMISGLVSPELYLQGPVLSPNESSPDKLETFREFATPKDGQPGKECYLIYCHTTGHYLPGTRHFFGEIIRTVEHLAPAMKLVVVHGTVAVKALFAFWWGCLAVSCSVQSWSSVSICLCRVGHGHMVMGSYRGGPTRIWRNFFHARHAHVRQ